MAERRRRVRTFEWSTAVIALTSVVAGTIVYLRDGSDKALAILTSDLWLFTGMLPKIAPGCSRARLRAWWRGAGEVTTSGPDHHRQHRHQPPAVAAGRHARLDRRDPQQGAVSRRRL